MLGYSSSAELFTGLRALGVKGGGEGLPLGGGLVTGSVASCSGHAQRVRLGVISAQYF